jgi:predicted aspartyl protease
LTAVILPLNPAKPFFVRVHGKYGVHELRAVIDTASTYCLMRRKDAIELGYHAYYDPGVANYGQGLVALTPNYIIKLPIVTLTKLEVGGIVLENVMAATQDMTEDLGVDVVLGQNFLEGLEACFDFAGHRVTLRRREGEDSP